LLTQSIPQQGPLKQPLFEAVLATYPAIISPFTLS